jgi:hypothetical protein
MPYVQLTKKPQLLLFPRARCLARRGRWQATGGRGAGGTRGREGAAWRAKQPPGHPPEAVFPRRHT